MSHRKPRPSGLTSNTTEQIFEYLDRIEAKLDHALSQIDRVKREQRSIAETELSLEIDNMAKFDSLLASVEKLKGRAASTEGFVKGLEAKIVEMAAGMNDEEDQRQVEAFAAEVGAIAETLPKAIEANPDPAEPVV